MKWWKAKPLAQKTKVIMEGIKTSLLELLIFIQIDKFLENYTEHHNRLG